jgi:hypothetical protein
MAVYSCAAPVRRVSAAGRRPEARRIQSFNPSFKRCRVQASRLVRSIPPGSTPAHRPDAGVHVKAGAERSGGQRNAAERRPEGSALYGRVKHATQGEW